MTSVSAAAAGIVGPHRGRTAAPAPGSAASRRIGRENRTMVKPRRRPRWHRVEQVVKLLVSVAGSLAELIDAFRRLR
jgi:hypothetical protein